MEAVQEDTEALAGGYQVRDAEPEDWSDDDADPAGLVGEG